MIGDKKLQCVGSALDSEDLKRLDMLELGLIYLTTLGELHIGLSYY